MAVDRSTRSLLASFFLLAALFVAMNRVVESAPAMDWWLPLILFVLGAGFALSLRYDFWQLTQVDEDAEPEALPSGVHSYRVTAPSPAPAAPPARLPTMTIRPDPESAEYAQAESILPFEEASAMNYAPAAPFEEIEIPVESETIPVSPETPAPVAEAQSPETPAPSIAEVPMSPETPAPETPPAKASRKTTAAAKPAAARSRKPAAAKSATRNPAAEAPPAAKPAARRSRKAAEAPPPAPEPAGRADDLVLIDGIGAKSALALRAAGIDSFEKLANASPEQIRTALSAANVRIIGEVETWSQQAEYAARGDWVGMRQFIQERRSAGG